MGKEKDEGLPMELPLLMQKKQPEFGDLNYDNVK
jgi:hypothetical protein